LQNLLHFLLVRRIQLAVSGNWPLTAHLQLRQSQRQRHSCWEFPLFAFPYPHPHAMERLRYHFMKKALIFLSQN